MIKKFIFFVSVFIVFQGFSQRSTSSPYSFFGMGEEFGTRTVEQITMGSIGASYGSSFQLNFVNPAALSDLRYAIYAFGLLHNELRLQDIDSDQSSNSTSLSYFSLGIPIGNGIGLIAGMQPTSAVGYFLVNSIEDADGELIDLTQFTGTGAINRLYGGFGARIFPGLSIGAEVDFLFGNVRNNVLNLRQDVSLATRNVEDTNIRGGSVKVAVQYRKVIKDDLYVNSGAAFKIGNTLKATGQEDLYSLSIGFGGAESPRDTIFTQKLDARFKRPTETTLGVGIGRDNKWYAELDYSFRNAYEATGYLDNSSSNYAYRNASAIKAGGFYIPNVNSISSYWKRVTYRAGVRYERTGLAVNGNSNGSIFTDINDFGISFGLGMPIGRTMPSNLNFAVEMGKKGTKENGLLQENYVNLRLSLSLNDVWFKKRRID